MTMNMVLLPVYDIRMDVLMEYIMKLWTNGSNEAELAVKLSKDMIPHNNIQPESVDK